MVFDSIEHKISNQKIPNTVTYYQEVKMDWIERLNNALKYIEENLTDKLEIKEIANNANTSQFHFQRLFAIITDITVAEYIRRRRLTLSATEIQHGNGILETAIKYRYESQASFTRAFSKMHGFTPGMVKKPGIKLKAYPPITFNISIKGAHSMDYEIREVEEFIIAGEVRTFSTVDGQNFKEIPLFWKGICDNKDFQKFLNQTCKSGILKGAVVGACMDFEEENEESINYMIGKELTEAIELSGMKKRVIPPATWAVFPGSGEMPDAIQLVWKRIFSEWFPATDYIHAKGPELEVYPCVGSGGSEKIPFEIWIPIEKK